MFGIEHPDHTGSSANPAAPWNAPDAFEGDHTCDECGHIEWGYGIDGDECGQEYEETQYNDAFTCDGILRAPEEG